LIPLQDVRFLADENFDNRILAGLRRRLPRLDVIRVQDSDLVGAEDPEILAWAAREDRLLLTHDAATMPAYAYMRVQAGTKMPGVIEVPLVMPIAQAIEDLLLFIEVSQPGEWENQVTYLPL
jgi:Domain of unknown function (DUF5615)